MKRYMSLILVGILIAVQVACTVMIPDAVRSEMNDQQASSGKQDSDANWHEYVVYRIDDHRFITIRSSQKCDGHLDGNIYYNDTRAGVHTYVSFTGSAANGLYRGYYVVHSDPTYIAIPSLAFSQTRGMMLHINYSHDGGRTFQWFLSGPDSKDRAIILDDKRLYVTEMNPNDLRDYSDYDGVIYDISQDMVGDVAHYDVNGGAFYKYGKGIPRQKIPFNLKSPSRETHLVCPAA